VGVAYVKRGLGRGTRLACVAVLPNGNMALPMVNMAKPCVGKALAWNPGSGVADRRHVGPGGQMWRSGAACRKRWGHGNLRRIRLLACAAA
jgi:hypothetical protein